MSDTSRLITPNVTSTPPSYVNLCSNVCSILFLLLISLVCFYNGALLFSFHPILMTTGWLILMTSAINAVTPGDVATEWIPIRLRSTRHWVIQVLAAVVIVIGFFIIVLNKFNKSSPHFVTIHAKFGLATFILMFLTKTGGLGVLYSLQMKYYIAPIYTKLIHASAGLITFTLGIVTIILALFAPWWKFGETLQYSLLILVLIIMLCTILRPCLKIYFRLMERFDNN